MHDGWRGYLTRHDGWRGTLCHVPRHVWHLDPAAMYGGVLFICPPMHGGEAKRTSFENIFEIGSNLKYVLNLG